ncbi:MAG: LysM peptidoglycan-binding domain-containing protein [Dehalococcoidia bacterium]|jgi:LysM repeat protein|nr:LysM peptidoglycan-binding domain-containing protein [Dehalococcoidia bacterium]
MRARLLAVAAAGIVLAGCGGGDDDPEPVPVAPTAVATATPFAVQPQPTIVAASSPAEPRQAATYIVEAGDTLSQIAERFDTSVEAIMASNELVDATLIFVGQELTIPAPEDAVDSAAGTSTDGSSSGSGDSSTAAGTPDASIYVVQPGDTAWAIANAHDSTIEELAEANNLTVEELASLQPGDSLTLPRPR